MYELMHYLPTMEENQNLSNAAHIIIGIAIYEVNVQLFILISDKYVLDIDTHVTCLLASSILHVR